MSKRNLLVASLPYWPEDVSRLIGDYAENDLIDYFGLLLSTSHGSIKFRGLKLSWNTYNNEKEFWIDPDGYFNPFRVTLKEISNTCDFKTEERFNLLGVDNYTFRSMWLELMKMCVCID